LLFGSDNPPDLREFINSTLAYQNWNYRTALKLDKATVHTASYDMIMDNPEDVINGVNKVEVVLHKIYFGIFGSLVIKHSGENVVNLVFNDIVNDAQRVIALFDELVDLLGHGYYDDQRSFSFNDHEKVQALANGRLNAPHDVIGHAWTHGDFGFNLSYRTKVQGEFVFSVTHTPKKSLDLSPRSNGTLIDILCYSIEEIVAMQEISAEPHNEEGKIKFIDYTFQLDPPELKIFDQVRVRIFNSEKRIDSGQFHVIYFSRYEIDTANVISFCDRVLKLYGADSSGYLEVQPYEIDMIDAGISWTGRNWWMNKSHGLKDFGDDADVMSYWLYFVLSPDEDGFSLHIVGYDNMLEYHKRSKTE